MCFLSLSSFSNSALESALESEEKKKGTRTHTHNKCENTEIRAKANMTKMKNNGGSRSVK